MTAFQWVPYFNWNDMTRCLFDRETCNDEKEKKLQLGQKSESINAEIDSRGSLAIYNRHEFIYMFVNSKITLKVCYIKQ